MISAIGSLLFKLDLWPREESNRYCKNSDLRDNVSNQKECQSICMEATACVGISYSYKKGSTKYCYMCKDDELSLAGNQFAFYRPQGWKYVTT